MYGFERGSKELIWAFYVVIQVGDPPLDHYVVPRVEPADVKHPIQSAPCAARYASNAQSVALQ